MSHIESTVAEDTWRVFRIMAEFVDGFNTLSQVGPVVTIFGSARSKPKDPYYKLTVKTAKEMVRQGFGVVTGGGPGLMEAANKGASEAGGESIGLNILLPFEQRANPYVKTHIDFHYFFVRKVMFLKYTHGIIVMPGGLGTMDELMESLTLVQTEKIHKCPIILMGADYWAGLVRWIKKEMLREKFINEDDLDLFHVTDDPEEAALIIKDFNVDYEHMKLD
ncbi:MAG: LOG family protein YvdD [bacterium ADurb.Bin236]|nr:MAG: LOG family protein YvdD [bacterium ADurb.Bin236]HOY62845.1 TIGR00730 family Rossman fold protein [bacterium]HPN93724.1 TIGR00730 family Rossman fold protein [bacterium]